MLTTSEKTDSTVLKSILNNQFSSLHVVCHFTGLPENSVTESITRLLNNKKIFLSVGGVPKRYSATMMLE